MTLSMTRVKSNIAIWTAEECEKLLIVLHLYKIKIIFVQV